MTLGKAFLSKKSEKIPLKVDLKDINLKKFNEIELFKNVKCWKLKESLSSEEEEDFLLASYSYNREKKEFYIETRRYIKEAFFSLVRNKSKYSREIVPGILMELKFISGNQKCSSSKENYKKRGLFLEEGWQEFLELCETDSAKKNIITAVLS